MDPATILHTPWGSQSWLGHPLARKSRLKGARPTIFGRSRAEVSGIGLLKVQILPPKVQDLPCGYTVDGGTPSG